MSVEYIIDSLKLTERCKTIYGRARDSLDSNIFHMRFIPTRGYVIVTVRAEPEALPMIVPMSNIASMIVHRSSVPEGKPFGWDANYDKKVIKKE